MRRPDFSEEKKLWKRGFKVVVGVDEVGRGAWAGPVVAGAVAWVVGESSPLRSGAAQTDFPTPALRAGVPAPTFAKASAGLGIRPSADGSRENLLRGTPPRGLIKFIASLGINDSKALGSQKRRQLADIIRECSLWSVAGVGVGAINRVGIGKATQMAMRKALRQVLTPSPTRGTQGKLPKGKTFVLVDGFHLRYLCGLSSKNQKALIKGDQKSISIASASILAKVWRDNLMKKFSRKFPAYGWAKNKGYGTKLHQKAILRYGLTPLHRKQFVETWLRKPTFQTLRNCL